MQANTFFTNAIVPCESGSIRSKKPMRLCPEYFFHRSRFGGSRLIRIELTVCGRFIHWAALILLLGWLSLFTAGDAVAAARRNVALASEGGVAVADSEYGEQAARFVNDGHWLAPGGNPATNRWHAALAKPHPHWVWIRFRQPARIDQVVLRRADLVDYPVDFVGEFSPDRGLGFQPLFVVSNPRNPSPRWSRAW